MYLKTDSIVGVKEYNIGADNVLGLMLDNKVVLYKPGVIYEQEGSFYYSLFNKFFLICETNDNNLLLVNTQNGQNNVLEGNFHLIYSCFIGNDSLLVYADDGFKILRMYNPTLEEAGINQYPKVVSGANGLYIIGNYLNCCRIDTGSPVWQIKIEEQAAGSLLQAHEDIVLIPLSNGKLIGIDVHTGVLLWEQSQMPSEYQLLDKRLYTLKENCLWIVEPATGQTQKLNIADTLQHHNLDVYYQFCVGEDYVYFVDDISKRKLAALNLTTLAIDWVYDFTGQLRESLFAPVFHQGKLYVKDTANTLHVFEREKS